MPMSLDNNLRRRIGIAVLAILVCLIWLPHIALFSSKLGLTLANSQIAGKEIRMTGFWMPLSAPGSLTERIYRSISQDTQIVGDQLVFVKLGSLFEPWKMEFLIFTGPIGKEGELTRSNTKNQTSLGALGQVILLRPKKGPIDYGILFSIDHGLYVFFQNMSANYEVTQVCNLRCNRSE